MTTLFSITTLAPTLGADTVVNSLLPIILDLVTDRIANIRLNVAKTLQSLVAVVDSGVVETKIKPSLNKLLEDKDRDVRYFTSIALQSCNQ